MDCRLKFLWTVNLGAGLGTVGGGANLVTPHSAPVEPATPVHMPITRRRSQPVVPQTMRPRGPDQPPPGGESPAPEALPPLHVPTLGVMR